MVPFYSAPLVSFYSALDIYRRKDMEPCVVTIFNVSDATPELWHVSEHTGNRDGIAGNQSRRLTISEIVSNTNNDYPVTSLRDTMFFGSEYKIAARRRVRFPPR